MRDKLNVSFSTITVYLDDITAKRKKKIFKKRIRGYQESTGYSPFQIQDQRREIPSDNKAQVPSRSMKSSLKGFSTTICGVLRHAQFNDINTAKLEYHKAFPVKSLQMLQMHHKTNYYLQILCSSLQGL